MFVAAAFAGAVPAHAQAVRIAVLADKGIETAEQEWAPVFGWLQRRVAGRTFEMVALDHPTLKQAVRDGGVDFVITNGGNYSELAYSDGVTRIATLDSPLALSPTQAVGSAIVARADSGLTELAQLKGKHLLAASPDAFCCYQIAARELVLAGVDPENDLGQLEFRGFPIQKIALAVQSGDADAGIIRTCLLEQMIESGAIGRGALRVLSPVHIDGFPCQTSSRLYPDWAFAATRATPQDLARAVAVALLEMPRTPRGYRWSIPAHYAVVDELFRDLKIGHYANLQQEAVEALLRRYRIALAFVLGLIVLWVVHTVRVEHLVARRTRELQDMQAERQRMAEAMRERQSALDHAGRLATLGEMAGAIAHELKQPLAAIANFARGIDRRVAAGRLEPTALQEGCNGIVLQSTRATATIDRIRRFARKAVGSVRPVDLGKVVAEAAELFGVAHPEACIRWCGAAVPAPVKADPTQLQQVTFNLLMNAWDAQKAIGNPHGEIELELARDGDDFRVDVRDCGGGLAAADLARLFEPFFTTKPEGLGLGLTLSSGIVEAHGGRLAVANGTAGACASFWLPAENPHE